MVCEICPLSYQPCGAVVGINSFTMLHMELSMNNLLPQATTCEVKGQAMTSRFLKGTEGDVCLFLKALFAGPNSVRLVLARSPTL